jgi:hypothetical protein
MRIAVLVVLALALALGAPASAGADSAPAVADRSLPFGCLFGWDFDVWCHPLDGPRLLVAGVGDKAWRSVVRFDLSGLRAEGFEGAEARLWFDGTCVDARGLVRACPPREYDVYAHAVLDPARLQPRDMLLGPEESAGAIDTAAGPQWVTIDLRALTLRWLRGQPNHGVVLRLGDVDERAAEGGPRLAASEEPSAALRPRLEVSYVPG